VVVGKSVSELQSNVSWKRHIIKKGGATQHHDQMFGDFKGLGRAQLAFLEPGREGDLSGGNSGGSEERESWTSTEIFSGKAGEGAAKLRRRHGGVRHRW